MYGQANVFVVVVVDASVTPIATSSPRLFSDVSWGGGGRTSLSDYIFTNRRLLPDKVSWDLYDGGAALLLRRSHCGKKLFWSKNSAWRNPRWMLMDVYRK